MSRFAPLPRFLPALLAATLLAGAAGCAPTGTEVGQSTTASAFGNRRVDPPPPGSDTQPAAGTLGTSTAPVSVIGTPGVMSSAELQVAYRAILERYVDQVDPAQLIQAATSGLREDLGQRSLPPAFSIALDLIPALSGDANRDWQGFARAYTAVVDKLAGWAGASFHPDWVAVRSMVRSLDDGHSVFLTPEDLRLRTETSYAGIGVRLARTEPGESPLVAEVFPNSPAERAGLRRGDRIVSADGRDLTGLTTAEVVKVIRGPSGSDVQVRVRRGNASELRTFTITRGTVAIEQVEGLLATGGQVGYLKLRSFSEETADQALTVLENGHRQGARGWILDLRGNGGGSLEAVRQVAAAFVDEQPIGYEVNRQGRQRKIVAQGVQIVKNVPVVVLIDGDSASGAEILAAALREYKVGPLVGATTAGNVGVASVIPLPDGSALQITEQRFVGPDGAVIDRVGVTPDHAVALTPTDLEAGRDPQLERASQLLAQQLTG